ncbi:MAG: hypothetical protein ACTTH5_04815 [Wolinella sp.]
MDFLIFAFVILIGYTLIGVAVMVVAMFWYVSLPLLLVGVAFAWNREKEAHKQSAEVERLNMQKREEAWRREVEHAEKRAREIASW